MLSLFGGVFAAISALRTFADADVKKRCEMRDAHFKLFKLYDTHDNQQFIASAKARFEKLSKRIKWWSKTWTIAQLTPIAFYLGFVIFIATWAVFNWAQLERRQDWIGWRCIVSTGVVIDVLAVAAMFVAWRRVRVHSIELDDEMAHFQTGVVSVKGDQPAPAIVVTLPGQKAS